MEIKISGIHHITVLAGNPQINYDFYTGLLGLKLVKKTINFDDPSVYHLYYGDVKGSPGTILTFFPFENARRGKRGRGEVSSISFSIPQNSLEYWINRFAEKAINFMGPSRKFGRDFISILDPDGMLIEFVADKNADLINGWSNGEIPAEHSIRKFFGAAFRSADSDATISLLVDEMGLTNVGTEGSIQRFHCGEGLFDSWIDIDLTGNGEPARGGAGSVHHIAWRTKNDSEQLNWKDKLAKSGYITTNVMDRNYFHSIYFREPGGILFEIATDPPGFLVDESLESLGTDLKLPSWYEDRRESIKKSLPNLKTGQLLAS